MNLRHLIVLANISVLVAGQAHAVPPPPPPPGAVERAARIITPPKLEDVSSYAAEFTESLKVYENDQLVAEGRGQWESYLAKRAGLHVTALNVSYGNPVIVVETINNMGPFRPGVIQDCCYWARVAAYHVGDSGLVDEITFLPAAVIGPPLNILSEQERFPDNIAGRLRRAAAPCKPRLPAVCRWPNRR